MDDKGHSNQQEHKHGEFEGCDHECDCILLVRVFLNKESLELKPGKYRGAEIKEKGRVPPAYELELVRKGHAIPISDTDEVTIRGCEKFIAFPCKGKAS